MGIDTMDTEAQFARIHRMIEGYRRAKRRRLCDGRSDDGGGRRPIDSACGSKHSRSAST